MALSPRKASRAGIRARLAAKRDTAASTLIQMIVTVCTRWIRRKVSGAPTSGRDHLGEYYPTATVHTCDENLDAVHNTGQGMLIVAGE
jgi:hypothetical protein